MLYFKEDLGMMTLTLSSGRLWHLKCQRIWVKKHIQHLNNTNLVYEMLVKSKPRCYEYRENSSLDCSFRMSIELRNNSTSD
jgi:hypothetical protein